MKKAIYSLLLSAVLISSAIAQDQKPEQFTVEPGRSADEYYNIGNWYSERDQHHKAIAYYQASLSKRSDFVPALINLGSSLRAVGRYDEAVKAYRTAITAGCKENFVYLNLGNAYVSAGKLKEAVTAFKAYIEKAPYESDGYANLGITLYRLKDYAGAVESFEKLLLLKENDSYFLFQTARCYALLKKFDLAMERARSALKIDPNVKYALMQEDDFKEFRRSPQFRTLLETAEVSDK